MSSLAALVSFGKITPEQKEEVEKLGLQMYSWDDFLQLVSGIWILDNVRPFVFRHYCFPKIGCCFFHYL